MPTYHAQRKLRLGGQVYQAGDRVPDDVYGLDRLIQNGWVGRYQFKDEESTNERPRTRTTATR